MASFIAATVPNLGEHQSALQLDTGELFIVEITNAPLATTDAAQWIAFKIRAWEVDTTGVPIQGMEIPAFTQTVSLASLTDGRTTIEDVIAQATAKAAENFRNLITAIATLQNLPKAGDVITAAQQVASNA